MKIRILPLFNGAMLKISGVKTDAMRQLITAGHPRTKYGYNPSMKAHLVTSERVLVLKNFLWEILTSEEAREEDLWIDEVNMKPHISRFFIARSTEVNLQELARENGCNVKLGKAAEIMGIYSCLFEAVWDFFSQETALAIV